MSMDAKRIIRQQKCTLSREALALFLEDYPIPKQHKVMLPNKNQSIYDAPKGMWVYILMPLLGPT